MESYADCLRRWATMVDEDYKGNVKRVLKEMMGLAGSIIGEELVTREFDATNKADLQRILDDWHQARMREACAILSVAGQQQNEARERNEKKRELREDPNANH